MSKERLSKLQKWILQECVNELFIFRGHSRQFYGKHLPPKRIRYPLRKQERRFYNWSKRVWPDGHEQELFSPKKELISTRSIEAIISRTFRNLVEKGFLTKGRFGYQLTEKGWLKANKNNNTEIVSFKDYNGRVEKEIKGLSGFVEGVKVLAEAAGLPKRR